MHWNVFHKSIIIDRNYLFFLYATIYTLLNIIWLKCKFKNNFFSKNRNHERGYSSFKICSRSLRIVDNNSFISKRGHLSPRNRESKFSYPFFRCVFIHLIRNPLVTCPRVWQSCRGNRASSSASVFQFSIARYDGRLARNVQHSYLISPIANITRNEIQIENGPIKE